MMPRCTSGRPTTEVLVATRASQPSATSKPPPSDAPSIAATTGFGQASNAAITAGICGSRSGFPNSLMSEPEIKVVPAPIRTADEIASSRVIAWIASTMPLRTSHDPALTGGLSITITPTTPSRSRRTAAFSEALMVSARSGRAGRGYCRLRQAATTVRAICRRGLGPAPDRPDRGI